MKEGGITSEATTSGESNSSCAPFTPPTPTEHHRDIAVSSNSTEYSCTIAAVTSMPKLVHKCKTTRRAVNHSYNDFSSVPPAPTDEDIPDDIASMSFPQKVYYILSKPEYHDCIAWMPHGRAFRVGVPLEFEKRVSPKFFEHNRYSTFLRALLNHAFKNITAGQDRNCYYHELMLRGMPHLCSRFAPPKDARNQFPRPDQEPDFYAISDMYPLPNEPAGRGGPKPQEPSELQGCDVKHSPKRAASQLLFEGVEKRRAVMPTVTERTILSSHVQQRAMVDSGLDAVAAVLFLTGSAWRSPR